MKVKTFAKIAPFVFAVLALSSAGLQAQWSETNLLGYTAAYNFSVIDTTLFTIAYGYILKTTDLGNTWSYAAQVPSDADPNRLLAVDSLLFLTTTFEGIFKSNDTGKTWSRCGDKGLLSNGSGAIFNVRDTLVTIPNPEGIFRSTDLGNSWSPMNRLYGDTGISNFVLDGQLLFAGTNRGGVFRSTDVGISWEDLTPWLKDTVVNAIAANGPLILAATWGAGIYRSTDYGSHWQSSNYGFSQMDVRALIFVGDTVFAGFNHGAGVYMSLDSGASWHDANEGLTDKTIRGFCVFGGYLFAGGGGSSGVWRRPLSNFEAVSHITARSANFNCYPNPLTQSTTIGFTSESGYAKVSVVNSLGQVVARLFDGRLDAGEHSFTWNAKGVFPGAYECVVQSGGNIEQIPLVVLR